MSQWSTFKSGPLATRNRAEIRAFAPIWRELVVHFQEWSTSYPEKGRNQANAQKSRASVVHFGEWSTSFPEKGGNRAIAPKSRELVVHFGEWSTGFSEKGRNQAKAQKRREPVVHFGEWTTSSGYLGPALPLPFQQNLQIPQLGG